jgi:5-methylcytosine-specific restriction endonuclease McrA
LKGTRCQTCRNAKSRRRRHRKEHAKGTYSKDEAWSAYIAQRASCKYCGCHIPYFGRSSHLDHLVPLSAGGANHIGNLVWACASCDERKGATLPWEWTHPL